jgi:hypothetical protein
VVRVDVDDHHIVEIALVRLLARMRQQTRGVEFLDRYTAAPISDEIHDYLLAFQSVQNGR